MERLTKKQSNGSYAVEEVNLPEAVARLAVFENICEELAAEQAALNEQLSAMKLAGKSKHYTFKEKMGKKLINSNVLHVFKDYGLNV